MRNVKKWGIFVAVCAVYLAVSFFVGSSGGKRKNAEPTTEYTTLTVSESTTEGTTERIEVTENETELLEESTEETTESVPEPETEIKTDVLPDAVPEFETVSESASIENEKKENICRISVSCKTILNNMDMLSDKKKALIPIDGVILPETEVEFEVGESVFDVVSRVFRQKDIHFEYSMSPVYNTAYIEGIANIYEFDCGELSGWTYHVNGASPDYGVSGYKLENGDNIELLYTCDLGRDVGNTFTE